MNKKIKTVIAFGLGFFSGLCAMSDAEMYLCRKGRMHIYLKDGVGNTREYGDRRIIPPSSTTEKEEVPE